MDYIIKRSKRKTIQLSINDDLVPVVNAPNNVSKKRIDEFVENNREWIISATERKREKQDFYNQTDINELKAKAKEYIPKRVEYYSAIMGVKPTGIKITGAKKRFGSCNGKNSICFSYYLMLYPSEAIDYVVVHELAHIKHHNHSRDFYSFISSVMPDYKEREKMLKRTSQKG